MALRGLSWRWAALPEMHGHSDWPTLIQGWTLRRRLLALVLVSLLPLLAAAYWLIDESVAQAKAGILRDSLLTAQATEAEISGSLTAIQRLLSVLAAQSTVRNVEAGASTDLFREALAAYPELLNVAAVDARGRIIAAALWETDAQPDVSDREYFRQMLRTGTPTVWPTRLTSRSTGLPTAVVVAPVTDQTGAPGGMVVGALSLQHLGVRLAVYRNAGPREVVVVDGEGTALLHSDWSHVVKGVSYAYSPAVAAALRGESGTVELDDLQSGGRVLVAYVPVTGTSWVLMVIHPVAQAYAAVWATMLRGLLVLLLGICATVALAFILLRWVSRPLDLLCARVRRRLEASLAARPERRDGDALQQLTDAFDSLATMLDTRAAGLAELRRQVESSNLKLERLSAEVIAAEAQQRKKIARDIHDGVAQLLATALVEAQEAEHYLTSDLGTTQRKIRAAVQLMRRVSGEIRCSLFELHPPAFEPGKLAVGLRDYLSRYALVAGLRCKLEVRGTPCALDPAAEAVIYHVLQEALQNVRKHARATRLTCCLCFEPGGVRLAMGDDGRGFVDGARSLPGHLGLVSMEERAREVGGCITVDSALGQGTTVRLEIPWSSDTRREEAFGICGVEAPRSARTTG